MKPPDYSFNMKPRAPGHQSPSFFLKPPPSAQKTTKPSRSYTAKMKLRAEQASTQSQHPLNPSKLEPVSKLLNQSCSERSYSPDMRNQVLRRKSTEPSDINSISWRSENQETTRTSRRYNGAVQSDTRTSVESNASAARDQPAIASHREVPSEEATTKLKSDNCFSDSFQSNLQLNDLLTSILSEIKGIKTRMTKIEQRMLAAQTAGKLSEGESAV